MKKLFFALLIVGATTMAATELKAQKASANFLMEAAIINTTDNDPENSTAAIAGEEINQHALRHFAKEYKNVSNAKWMNLKDGYQAKFKHDGIIESVFYNLNGSFAGTLKGYEANKLPTDIMGAVKENYKGYIISYVNEAKIVNGPSEPTYLVQLKGIENIKVLRLCEDEMDVLFDSEKVEEHKRF